MFIIQRKKNEILSRIRTLLYTLSHLYINADDREGKEKKFINTLILVLSFILLRSMRRIIMKMREKNGYT